MKSQLPQENKLVYKEMMIKKFPYLSYSSNLIEYFIIVGYDKLLIKHKILNDIENYIQTNSTENDNNNINISFDNNKLIYTEYQLDERPTILSSISSDYKKSMLDDDILINLSFPSSPKAYYYTINNNNNKLYEPRKLNIVFFINGDSLEDNSKIPFHGYTFIFYEIYKIRNDIVVYIPNSFVIISQFPLFNLFNSICKDILKMFKESTLEIPIEILIYNLVNFVPSPINLSYTLDAFPNMPLSYYNRNTNVNGTNSLNNNSNNTQTSQNQLPNISLPKINQINGYPVIDFNICEIFHIFEISTIVEIFIYSLLECEMVFFSKNLEMLNIMMYLISVLSYPSNDTMYLWHIVSVDKEEIINPNCYSKFVGKPFASMIGINCEFDESIETSELYHTHFIIDLDNKNIIFRFDEHDYSVPKLKKEIDQLISLKEYIENITENKSKVESHFLKNKIQKLLTELENISYKIQLPQMYIETSTFAPSFFGSQNHNITLNKLLQESFYNFILSLLGEYYTYYKLNATYDDDSKLRNSKVSFKKGKFNPFQLNNSLQENSENSYDLIDISNDDNNSEHSFLEQKEKSPCGASKYYTMYYKENFSLYSNCEKIFTKIFVSSQRYIHFMKDFISINVCLDIYKIPLLFSEEFLLLKNKNEEKFNLHFFEVIDMFYNENSATEEEQMVKQVILIPQTEEKIIKNIFANEFKDINFNDFYSYYNQHLKKYFFEETVSHPCIKVRNSIAPKQKITYKYRYISLDSSLLSKYVHHLMNLDTNKLQELFPSILLKKCNDIIQIPISSITSIVEKSLIKYKLLQSNDILLHGIFYIVCYFIHCIDNPQDIAMLIKLLKQDKYCIRKYITLLIKSVYKLSCEKLAQNKSIQNEWNVYTNLIDLLRDQRIIPNEELMCLINNFSKIEEGLSLNMISIKETTTQNNEEEIKRSINNLFRFEIFNNSCKECESECESKYDKKHFLRLGNNIDYKGNLKVDCENCNSILEPSIKIKKVLNKEFPEINVYSPMKILKECINKINGYFNNQRDNMFYKDIQNVIINLIFYYSDEIGMEDAVYFLYKCLCEIAEIQAS